MAGDLMGGDRTAYNTEQKRRRREVARMATDPEVIAAVLAQFADTFADRFADTFADRIADKIVSAVSSDQGFFTPFAANTPTPPPKGGEMGVGVLAANADTKQRGHADSADADSADADSTPPALWNGETPATRDQKAAAQERIREMSAQLRDSRGKR
jgi:hypothetical protein